MMISSARKQGLSINAVVIFLSTFVACVLIQPSYSYSTPSPSKTSHSHNIITRASFFRQGALMGIAGVLTTTTQPSSVMAIEEKQLNLSDEELKKIITADMVERSFLVSADLTRSVYDESSIFTDEIDSYPIEKWVKGTQKLFVAEGSSVNLVGDVVVSADKVEFRFDEDLMFRIPFRPVVSLTGKVVLKRDANTGLITDYREFWDQGVGEVLRTAKFNF